MTRFAAKTLHIHTSFSCWIIPQLLLISDHIFLHDHP